ncbi:MULTISPECIES: energy-coupling factor ABC transporter permease [Dehalobacter]|jgi:cobalt/nickel transport system permease protein|uniref:Cobalamin biosynthesis protein CbiM n=1 Tax=Dehalobacter restrictus (strain DSM 9455 / PER-K23) TaxID=871738 RepID=A0ABN4BU80_DEHRP|nr:MULTISPECIES: energy-coupling factor ABC transporter permease [Dehalobacter]AHF10978.1 cobalamin biosynthesis protein CbiM [Dehalobacter restrictus DSM 9455]MDJ0307074.1 energy-coupling factor ABC transporter permease [Dehalobacter sp.]OCZ49612.1 cobalamin biosynthesis protein CbiM [Dehalobacter sp. TeCB1]
MHMADALISPVIGGTMWVATAGVAAYSIKKIQDDMEEKKVPLMGVMGAFVFAAQMINFSIPGTGSSGHLGGGLILAAMLGPYAGFLAMASILLIQALFFGDGGLLAYGCNVFNLGFYTCFIAYPLISKWFIKKGISAKRIMAGSMIAAVVGLQLGAFSVVLETFFSGKTELPFSTFVLMMQPIHLAIGIVEGLVTAAVLTFVWKARPELIEKQVSGKISGNTSIKRIIYGLAIAAVIIGGGLSWFASSNPDGLEWSMEKTAGITELAESGGIYGILADIQSKTAFLPDYSFKNDSSVSEEQVSETSAEVAWPAVDAGTTVSGLVGGAMTLVLAVMIGFFIRSVKRRKKKVTA